MALTRFTTRALATAGLWAGVGLTANAQLPTLTVEKAFEAKPRQPGVAITTPPADQIARHRIDPIPNPDPKAGSNMGYVVRDPAGRPVRQFVSYDGKQFNIVAFYVDGLEAYREVYPPQTSEPHQYRWLGPNGGKWGLDKDRDGKIDEWVVISPEEVSQELLQAVLTRDAKRLDALLPSKENLESIGLPPAEAAKIKDRSASAAKRLTEAAEALKLSPEAKWVHLELGIPHTTPADAFRGREDLVVHKNGTVLIEDKGKTHFLQVGELVQVGRAWKVVDGPSAGPGGVAAADTNPGGGPVITPEIAPLVKQIDELDKTAPNPPTPAAIAEYYGKRADVLEQIVQKLPPDKQGDWLRLWIDSLSAAADGGKADSKAHTRLKQVKDSLVKAGPTNPMAAYAAFRLLTAENGIALNNAKQTEIAAVQEKWRAGLEEFVKAYQTSEDAPEAVLRLAMACEFAGKEKDFDGEAKAKTWYEFLTKTYPQHPHVAKAAGALKRLDCEGKPFDLQGPNLANGQPFSAGQLNGKVVVVFYWASWSTSLAEDAKKLKELATAYGPKGLTLLTVCLDDDPKAAAQAVQALGLPGTHLHARGGLDASPLSTAYGVMVAPHLFLVGKDGKVTNRNAQLPTLEDEIKNLTK